jgi:hypothetical protein
MSGVLEAATTTGLTRTTVHAQYNRKGLGVVMLNNLIPIVLHVTKPGRKAEPKILLFGGVNHATSPYQDLGTRNVCCRKVITFNVQHYVKCYLTDDHTDDGPYTFNYCQKCGATLTDACNHLVQTNQSRKYNVDKFIYKADSVLQSDGPDPLFNFQRSNC